MTSAESGAHDRERTQLERLTFFSDAVFAIAITLLVIEVHVPELHHPSEGELLQALLDLLPNYVGFIVSFFVIGRFWLGHHRMFGMLRRADDRLIFANILMLLGIAFMPFPTAVFSAYVGLKTATLLYCGWLAVVGLFNFRLVRTGLRAELLAPDHDPVLKAHLLRGTWLPILLGLLAMAVAFAGPLWSLLVLLVGPLVGSLALHRVRLQRVATAGAEEASPA